MACSPLQKAKPHSVAPRDGVRPAAKQTRWCVCTHLHARSPAPALSTQSLPLKLQLCLERGAVADQRGAAHLPKPGAPPSDADGKELPDRALRHVSAGLPLQLPPQVRAQALHLPLRGVPLLAQPLHVRLEARVLLCLHLDVPARTLLPVLHNRLQFAEPSPLPAVQAIHHAVWAFREVGEHHPGGQLRAARQADHGAPRAVLRGVRLQRWRAARGLVVLLVAQAHRLLALLAHKLQVQDGPPLPVRGNRVAA
eukprot:CAMPEP_0176196310 /NCGR_PEP_ID=MMETSP0121_2-20121125/6961_1 /TAXON_ID=160619 /ORGANISM="Kryptoperidinium foliaceum, Strain CCMP 1326" /LENGTH=252 /DNA_ID=CAMNT_0017535105 /DNA_START=238 /DNA_END=997 /DNA_ORIENTATION=-